MPNVIPVIAIAVATPTAARRARELDALGT
jgi:hypothetical protein